MTTNLTSHFQTLGFTQLESEIYLYLLKNGVSTGYSIGKGINKPAANVYKALDTLGQKGGVISASGNNKTFNAVDWRTLLDNRAQVIETTLKMIADAHSVILADIEPDALPLFSDALVDAAKRGVEVRVKLYEAAELEGVIITLRRHGAPIHAKSNDVAFSFSCDGFQFVLAMLSKDQKTVIQAFQSQSALMTMTMHTQILYGQVLTDLKDFLKNDEFDNAKSVLANTEHLHPLSAENVVFQRYKTRYKI